MSKKDFFRMPIGIFEATDGIYNYTIKKSIALDGIVMYTIKEKGSLSNNSVSMFESEEDYFDFESRFKIRFLTALSGVGGITVHGHINYYDFENLKLIPRGSFKNLSNQL